MIEYQGMARVRRELENIIVLIDELEKKGVPRKTIVKLIQNESENVAKKNECSCEDQCIRIVHGNINASGDSGQDI